MRRALLAGLLVTLAAAGCTPLVIPPAVGEAEAMLGRREVRLVAVQRPKLIAEATTLAQRARETAERGEREQATLLAWQAMQKVQIARNFATRETTERGAQALERAKRSPLRAEASLPPTAPPPTNAHAREARHDGSLRALAERILVRLALRRSELLGQLRDQSCGGPYREFEAVFELAQRRFDAGDHEGAYELAVRAQERLRACDGLTPTGSVATAAASAQLGSLSPRRDVDDEPARRKAASALQKAQVELARVRGLSPDDPAVGQAESLLTTADTWYSRRSYPEVVELASRATTLLARPRPPAPDGARDAAEAALLDARAARAVCGSSRACAEGGAQDRALIDLTAAEKAWKARAFAAATERARQATEGFREALACARAAREVREAREARGLQATREEPSARRLDLVRQAEARLEVGACAEASALALAATREVAPQPAAPAPARAQRPSDDAMTRARAFVDERLNQVPPVVGFEPSWREAYRAVFLATALRDQGEQTSPQLSGPLAEADALLLRARQAWDKRDYPSAARLAEEARRLVAPLAAPPPDQGTPDVLAQARRRAQWALRAAANLVSACESARCSVRVGHSAEMAPRLLTAAHAALDDGRAKAAFELAKRAELHLAGALRAPLVEHAAAAPSKASADEVDRAIEAAEVAKVGCDEQRCEPAIASQGQVALGLALASRADGRLDDALRDASRASQRLRLAGVPRFDIPVQVRGLQRVGSQLIVSPALAWRPYSTELTATSEAGVAALARTLGDNRAALRRVRLVVRHTADAAAAAALALGRAKRLRAALVARGVPEPLLEVEAALANGLALPALPALPYAIELELADGAP